MGVDGLWELLSPAGSHVPVEALSGRTYAIDASIWFHQFIQAMRDSEGMMMRNAHLIGFARRCCKLLFLNVKPVFVFDGTPHPLKYATLKQRRKEREKQEWKIRRTAEKLIIQQFLHNQKSSGEVPATSVTVKSHVADQQEPEPAPSSAKRRRSNPEDEVADDERVYKDQGIEALMEQRKSMRVQNREEAIVQAFAPEAFSRQQLAGFLKSAQLNRQISSARGMRCSGVGRTVKRIASDPAKEYVLEHDTTMNYKGVLSGNFPTLETVPHRKEPVPWGTEWAARAIHASDLITAEENSRGRKRGLPLQDSDAEDSLEWEVVGGADDEVPVARASDTIEDDPVLRGFEKAFEIVRMKNGELDLRDPSATEINAEEPPKSFCRHPGPEIPQHTQSESRIIGDDHRPTDLEALKSCSDSNRQSDNISHKDYLSDASPLENQGQAYSLGLKHHLETDGTETVNGEALVPEALLVKEQRDIQMTEILPVISHTEDTPRLVNHDNSQSLEENVAIDRDLSKDFEDIEWTGSPGISHRILSPKLTDDSNHSSAPDIMSPIWNTDMNVSPEPFVPQFGSISEEMLEETKLLLDLFGIPYLEAPQEAEAQCAFLNLAGLVDGVITDDGDALLFGAQQVLRNVFRQSKYVEMYKLDHLERELGLDREKLVALALLLGCDYCSGIRGVGIVNAMEIIEAYPSLEDLDAFKSWLDLPTVLADNDISLQGSSVQKIFSEKHINIKKNWSATQIFPDKRVMDAFMEPHVNRSRAQFTFGPINVEGLSRFCYEKLGWSHAQFEALIKPTLKASESIRYKQTSLLQFFPPERFAKIRSERLKTAVRGVKGTKKSATGKHHRKRIRTLSTPGSGHHLPGDVINSHRE